MTDFDATAHQELLLYIENDGDLYRQQHIPIIKNLMSKRSRGEWDGSRAVDLFVYLAEAGAKKYAAEHGDPRTPWHVMFPPAVRRAVAGDLTKHFEAEADLGGYNEYIPKKYREAAPRSSSGRRAAGRRAAVRKTPAQLEREISAGLGGSSRSGRSK